MKILNAQVDLESYNRNVKFADVLAALYTINRKAKNYRVIEEQKRLYQLKCLVLKKLLKFNKAKIIGIHQRGNLNFVVIKSGDYEFHRFAAENEIKNLKILGSFRKDQIYRSKRQNRRKELPFYEAIYVLNEFLKGDVLEKVG